MSEEELKKILAEYAERHSMRKLSEMMGMCYVTLNRMLNPNDDYNLPITRLVSLIVAADKDFTVLDHIEARLGRIASMVDSTAHPCDISGLSRFNMECSNVMKVFSDSLKDNKISQKEASKCIRALNELLQVIMGIIQRLKMIENGTENS